LFSRQAAKIKHKGAKKNRTALCVKQTFRLLNRDWVDDRLHAAGDACWPKRE
jgi:hypothetical protein